MMQHWSERIPGRVFCVDYESLVSNLDSQARALTRFLDCEFDPVMLNTHQQQGVVATASHLQVRKPVYKTSIGNWKNYRSKLDGVIRLLQDHGVLNEAL